MNILNRREVYITMDIQKFSQVISILDNENIRYTYKTFNTSGVRAGTVQAIGLNSNYMYQYYVYVHKNDYDRACVAINKLW